MYSRVNSNDRMALSSAIPTTVRQGESARSTRKQPPSALRPGHRARAIPSLTTATGALPARSSAPSARPATIRVPVAAK